MTYIMPTCEGCKKRYRVDVKDCMMIRLSFTNKKHETRLFPNEIFCPKCMIEFRRLGPRKFFEELRTK